MKTIVVTGGGRGLGRATAEALAVAGHQVLLTARDPASGERAVRAILTKTPDAKVEARLLDLGSLASVKAFATRLVGEKRPIDGLLNVAGIMQQSPVRRTTTDGFEETLGVNVLGPYLLTRLLLPALERSPAARVVNVSSRLHLPGSRGVPVAFDFDDPMLERSYHPQRAYKNSKLAMLWFSFELQRRLAARPVTSNAVCPGFVPATVAAGSSGFQKFLMLHVLAHMPFATSVEDAVRSFVFMATDPALDGVGGAFYADRKPFEPSEESRDPAKSKRFWEYAASKVGLSPALD